jgi:hypothetical protein
MDKFSPVTHLFVFGKYKVTKVIEPNGSDVTDVSNNNESDEYNDGFSTPRDQPTDLTMPPKPRKIRTV